MVKAPAIGQRSTRTEREGRAGLITMSDDTTRRVASGGTPAIETAGRTGAAMKSTLAINAFAALLIMLCATSVGAQTAAPDIYLDKGADRAERLAAKARAEGTLTLYTSLATTESGPLDRKSTRLNSS